MGMPKLLNCDDLRKVIIALMKGKKFKNKTMNISNNKQPQT